MPITETCVLPSDEKLTNLKSHLKHPLQICTVPFPEEPTRITYISFKEWTFFLKKGKDPTSTSFFFKRKGREGNATRARKNLGTPTVIFNVLTLENMASSAERRNATHYL